MSTATETPTDIDALQTTALTTPADGPIEAFAEILSRLDGIKSKVRDAEKIIKARVKEWMEEHEVKRIELGDGRYWYLGHDSDWDNTDVPGTIEALLEANGGDVRALAEFVASGGLKPGACRNVLPADKRDVLFVKVKRTVLKDGTPVAKKLIAGDERFTIR